MDAWVRSFLDDLAALGPMPAGDDIRSVVRDFAADREYWDAVIALGGGGHVRVHRGESGPQIVLSRRTDGAMSAIHSHGVWVAVTALQGVETHRRYRSVEDAGGGLRAELVEEARLVEGSGSVVVLTPPGDIHSHGHLRGSGPWPYSLVVLGGDQMQADRLEFDDVTGMARVLPPGDRGSADLAPQSVTAR